MPGPYATGCVGPDTSGPSGARRAVRVTLLRCCALALFGLACSTAAPKVEKVEPPNWWTPHTLNPIQVLLTGSDLKGTTVTTASKGFKIDVRAASDAGRY